MNINLSRLLLTQLAIIIGAVLLFIWANSCGLGYTPDSYYYLRVDTQIQNYGLFNAPGLGTMPPALPLAIGLIGEANMVYLNVLCLIGTILVIFQLSIRLKSTKLRYLLSAFMGGLTPLYLVSSFLWTEPLFTLLLAIIYLLFIQTSDRKRNIPWILLILLSLPFLRYAAVFILIPLVVLVFFHANSKMRRIIGSIILSTTILFVVWVFRFREGFSVRLSDLLDPLMALDISFYLSNAKAFLLAMGSIIIPLIAGEFLVMLLGTGMISVILYAIYKFWSNENHKVEISFLVIFLFYYIALHLVFPIEYDTADRYLTPLYPMLIFTVFSLIDKPFGTWSFLAKKLLVVCTIMIASYGYIRTIKNVHFWHDLRCEENIISQL